MAKSKSEGQPGNRLLCLLPPEEYRALEPLFREIALASGQAVYEARSPIKEIYFPLTGALSAVTVMRDGAAIEVATIGNEGAVGLPNFGTVASSPHRVFCQVPGSALCADAAAFNHESARLPKLRETLANYHSAFLFQISQCVACNGLHVIVARCCRWLLMTHDRVTGDEVPLTHEFLAYMLGVRRPGVTEVLQSLRELGLIRYGKGKIIVLNRPRLEKLACECYQSIRDEYQRLLG